MNNDELRRENHKQLLDCTDEQLDRFYEIIIDASILGVNVDIDGFFNFLAKEKNILLNGMGSDNQIGIIH